MTEYCEIYSLKTNIYQNKLLRVSLCANYTDLPKYVPAAEVLNIFPNEWIILM